LQSGRHVSTTLITSMSTVIIHGCC